MFWSSAARVFQAGGGGAGVGAGAEQGSRYTFVHRLLQDNFAGLDAS